VNINSEEHYPKIVNNLVNYIINIKETGSDDSMFDLVVDYCIKKNVPIELVSDAIDSDECFKDLIRQDNNFRELNADLNW